MTRRQRTVCSHLPRTEIFADVGCDHGYMAQYALKKGLCRLAYVSDVSEGSLKKAKELLKDEIAAGRCVPVLADGMKGLPENCGCVLIAGLGGEEIVRILSEGYLPPEFVLQPMKNAEKVRAFLIARGCGILADYTFSDGRYYYDLIAGKNAGEARYSDFETEFGRDNLKLLPEAFRQKLYAEQRKLRALLSSSAASGESRKEILERLYRTEVVIDAFEGDI